MKLADTLTDARHARLLADYGCVHDLGLQIENEADGTFTVWVEDDANLPAVRATIARLRAQPDAPDFLEAPAAADRKRRAEAKQDQRRRSTVSDSARLGYERNYSGNGRLTILLLILMLAVAAYTQIGNDAQKIRYFLITDPFARLGGLASGLHEITSGQVWRLITPALLHFGIIHALFNAMMLRDLGTFVESRYGSRHLFVLFLLLAAIPNLLQYWWNGPTFGGMSGVNYGLFGYLWIRGKTDRTCNWRLNPAMVYSMMAFYGACIVGLIPHVANAAHTGGLLLGMTLGWVAGKTSR